MKTPLIMIEVVSHEPACTRCDKSSLQVTSCVNLPSSMVNLCYGNIPLNGQPRIHLHIEMAGTREVFIPSILTRVGYRRCRFARPRSLDTMPSRCTGGEVHSGGTKKQEIPRALGLRAHIDQGPHGRSARLGILYIIPCQKRKFRVAQRCFRQAVHLFSLSLVP